MSPDSAICRVEVFGYELTYAHGDYVMSSGRVVNRLSSTVVRITTRGGITGFGECCPLGPLYLPAFAEGARAAMRTVGPAILGADACNLAEVTGRMDGALKGHEYARSALDVACWDALGKHSEQPVSSLLGGALQAELPLYVAVPMGAPQDMADFVSREKAKGIHRFQLKVGGEPHDDAERIRLVHEITSPGDVIVADANGAWLRQDAIIAARLLEPLDRVLLEQPCRTLEECIAIRGITSLPMVLDEVITDTATLVRAAEAGAMDHLNLKIGRVGGLTAARQMRDLAVDLGLRLTIEDTWGGDLVTAAVAHLAAGTQPAALFAVSFMNDWTREHIAGYQPRSKDWLGPVPQGAGLGVHVDAQLLGEPLFRFEG